MEKPGGGQYDKGGNDVTFVSHRKTGTGSAAQNMQLFFPRERAASGKVEGKDEDTGR